MLRVFVWLVQPLWGYVGWKDQKTSDVAPGSKGSRGGLPISQDFRLGLSELLDLVSKSLKALKISLGIKGLLPKFYLSCTARGDICRRSVLLF